MEIVGPSAHLLGRGFGHIKTVLPFGKAEFTKGSSNVGSIGSTLYPSAWFTSFDALELVKDEVDLPAIAVALATTRSASVWSYFGIPAFEAIEPLTLADPATDQLPSKSPKAPTPLMPFSSDNSQSQMSSFCCSHLSPPLTAC